MSTAESRAAIASAWPFSSASRVSMILRSRSTCFLLPAVAGSASFRGSRKLRAYPSATFTISPRRPRLSTCSLRITSMVLLRRIRDERQLPCPHDRGPQLPLVHRARAGDAPRQDLGALGHERHQELDVLVVDVVDLVR